MIRRSVIDHSVVDMFFQDSTAFDFHKDREAFIKHMDSLKTQGVEESTLYKKWIELKQLDNTKEVVSTGALMGRLWAPTDIFDKERTVEEIDNLKPQIVICKDGTTDYDDWKYLRMLISSFEFSIGIGRLIKILVLDENTGKVLGVSSIASDVISIGVRDNWIGWTKEDKFEKGKLNQTCIGSTIVPTQPFGYNFLGGKLIASLLCTNDVRDAWKNKFDQKLVGMTTTSLYGGHSMYQFQDTIREHADTRDELVDELAKQRFSVHDTNVVHDLRSKLVHPPSGPKQNVLNRIYSHLGMKSSEYVHGFKRGVYFAPFYENTREYLRSEIEESELVGSRKLENDVDDVMDWWKPKAIRRYTNLIEQDRIRPEHLYYRDMIQMRTWEEVQQKYMSQVGR